MNTYDTLEAYVQEYSNTAENNDSIYTHFGEQTLANPLLTAHRNHIEKHELGFGDAAFHHMWLLLLQSAAKKFSTVHCLEIGVFKGQVISLWSLLMREFHLQLELTAITPLKGNPVTASRISRKLRYWFSPKFREEVRNGNFYPSEDYELAIKNLFSAFQLDFDSVHFERGFSNNPDILSSLRDKHFEIIYIDGDHTYDGVMSDFKNFGPKVPFGGWIIVDDASLYNPGTAFWKGHEAVSRACDCLPELGFTNILNIGHNRIFQRIE